VAIARAFTRPQKAPIGEEVQGVMQVHPRRILLFEQRLHPAGRGIGLQQFEPVLNPRQALDGKVFSRRKPLHPGNQRVRGRANLHPAGLAAGGSQHPEADAGIRCTSLREPLGFEHSLNAGGIHMRMDGLHRNIKLKVSNRTGVRRPPPRPAQVQLFGVDPIELAIPQGFRAILRQPANAARSHLGGVQVRSAPEGDGAAVRGEMGVLFGLGRRRHLRPLPGGHIEQEQVATLDDQQPLRVGGPLRPGTRHAAILPAKRLLARLRGNSFRLNVLEVRQIRGLARIGVQQAQRLTLDQK
jgi:hypothetical protein